MQERSQYSAAAPLLGYFYQCRLALLEFLKRLRSSPDMTVSIETLDDVVFEKNNDPTEVIQVKHHITRKASLTNTSTDLWKTFRIWCDLFSGGLAEKHSILCLMTTEMSPKDSAAFFLRTEKRNISRAEQLLLRASGSSSNEANREGYHKFNSLTPEDRKKLLEQVYILDNCPSNKDLTTCLTEELRWAAERQHTKQLLTYLEGWWFQRIIDGLDDIALTKQTDKENEFITSQKNTSKSQISGQEMDTEINNLREQFKEDSLPIDPKISSANPDIMLYKDRLFARQLRLIHLSENSIRRAAKNFYKAEAQRSQWVREALLVNAELEEYNDKLIEEWEIHFDQATDSLPPKPTDEDKITSGQKVFHWVEADANIAIRPHCQDSFITRGSYQMLADHLRVGWHPDFKTHVTLQSEEKNV